MDPLANALANSYHCIREIRINTYARNLSLQTQIACP
jgi:hypothetical protein